MTHPAASCFKFGASENEGTPRESFPSNDSSAVAYQNHLQRVPAAPSNQGSPNYHAILGIGMMVSPSVQSHPARRQI